jgi:sugar-specific transcriptional regulator TrmB/predicted hydrocarbon binding protein
VGRAGQKLIDLLVARGLPEPAARIYLTACRDGPQTASELARLNALHRVHAYRFIARLVDDGLLAKVGHRPMRFAALPIEELLERWIETTSEDLTRLKTGRQKLLAEWQESLTAPDVFDARKFLVLEGQPAIHNFLRKRAGAARREILASASAFALARAIDGGIDRAFREARERGVRVRMVTEVTQANLPEAKHFTSFLELRHATSPVTNRAVVIDGSGALVYVSGEEGLGASGDAQVALWSTSPRFLSLTREYHRRLWARARPADDRIVELESPPIAVLPVRRGASAEGLSRLNEITDLGMEVTGLRELKLDVRELIEAIARQLGRQIAEGVEGSTPEEVAHSLTDYYEEKALGRLSVVRDRPLTLRVTGCFACTASSPEVGRVMCPSLLRSVLETRLGSRWEVSKPDPTRHATRGCLFTVGQA